VRLGGLIAIAQHFISLVKKRVKSVKCFQHRHSPNLRVRNATYSDSTAFYLTLEEKNEISKNDTFSKDLKDSGKVKVFKGKIKIYVLS